MSYLLSKGVGGLGVRAGLAHTKRQEAFLRRPEHRLGKAAYDLF